MQVIVRHLERPPLIDRFPPDEPTQTATMTPARCPAAVAPRPLACRATVAVAMQQLSNAPLPSIRTWRCAPVEQDAFREYFAHQQRAGLGALAELSTPSARLDDELAALLAGGYDHEIGSGPSAPVLWILFATTGVFVIAIVTGIRLFFRRGKSVTDL